MGYYVLISDYFVYICTLFVPRKTEVQNFRTVGRINCAYLYLNVLISIKIH